MLGAGCGYAELSLALPLAAKGYTVVVDLTPTAIAAATKAAEERGLRTLCRPAGLAQRARTVLLAADVVSNTEIASRLGVSRPR